MDCSNSAPIIHQQINRSQSMGPLQPGLVLENGALGCVKSRHHPASFSSFLSPPPFQEVFKRRVRQQRCVWAKRPGLAKEVDICLSSVLQLEGCWGQGALENKTRPICSPRFYLGPCIFSALNFEGGEKKMKPLLSHETLSLQGCEIPSAWLSLPSHSKAYGAEKDFLHKSKHNK